MTKKQAAQVLEQLAVNATGELGGKGNDDPNLAKLLQEQIEAFDMAIEALTLSKTSKQNARAIGIHGMLFQTMEECAELTTAIAKYNRTNGIGQKTEYPRYMAWDDMMVEIADVSICIEQLIYLLQCTEDIEEIRYHALEKVKNRYFSADEVNA